VRAAARPLVEAEAQRAAREVLGRLERGLATGERAVAGLEDTLRALNERRVETLLLGAAGEWEGTRCPTCGLLLGRPNGSCPADGSTLERVRRLRDAAIQAALLQDAAVQIPDPAEPEPLLEHHGEIAAVLRF
jgi:peptide subunit release factor 1 (eRF1)